MRCGEAFKTISSCSDVRVELGDDPGVSLAGCCGDAAKRVEFPTMPPIAMAAPVTICRRVRRWYDAGEFVFAFITSSEDFPGSAQRIGTRAQTMFKNIFCSPM
jgi:hypothetical protein